MQPTELHLARTLKIWSRFVAVIPNFYLGEWECDIFTLNKTGFTAEYEIKLTKADYLKDFEKLTLAGKRLQRQRKKLKSRHPDWELPELDPEHRKHFQIENGHRTNYFWFVVPAELAQQIEIPKYAGLITFTTDNDRNEIVYTFKKEKKAPLLHKNKIDYPRTGTFRKIVEAYYHRGNIIPRKNRRKSEIELPEFPEFTDQKGQRTCQPNYSF